MHGTDCLAWYLYAGDQMPAEEFRETYLSRREAIRAKNLPEQFQPFLDRLNSL